MDKLVIIGNGVAGTTVARHARKHDSKIDITIISSETDHFFSRTALMYIYMGHMTYENTKPYEDHFWTKNRINLKRAHIEKIDFKEKRLITNSNEEISYDKLVLATGSKPNKFGWPGQDLPGVQGLFSYQDLELMEKNSENIKNAAIIGGGLIGIEMAEMLMSRGISVTLLVRESRYWGNILPDGEAKLIEEHIREHGATLKLSTELKEIKAGKDGRVASIICTDGNEIECQFVGLTAGVHPNIDFINGSELESNRGILVNDYLETNISDVYACGDCAEIKASDKNSQNRIEPLWYTGRMQAEALAKTITKKQTKYERGIWFNSAKFFDIEYQTYGFVPSKLADSSESFYWEEKENRRCINIIYSKDSYEVTGINVFGIRLRQNVCQNWIKQKRQLKYVISHMKDANFDPEFFKAFEPSLLNLYNEQFSEKILLEKKKWTYKRVLDWV
jgi:3-phenylpropionate/trans-cinnamate dioxygenase ferredoxin reductase component